MLSLACSCPPVCASRRTPWCDDLGASEPDRSCTAHCSGVPVAAAVETMPDNLARGSFDGRDPAQAGEGSLATQPLGVVPGHDQQRGGVVGAYACQTDQLRGDLPNQPIELCVQLGDLCRESLVTASHLRFGRSTSSTSIPCAFKWRAGPNP